MRISSNSDRPFVRYRSETVGLTPDGDISKAGRKPLAALLLFHVLVRALYDLSDEHIRYPRHDRKLPSNRECSSSISKLETHQVALPI